METDAATADKSQVFAHRLVEFADYDKCVKFFTERGVAFNRSNDMGWSILMSVCACGRDDLVGFVADRTTAVDCATNTNRTTVLHLTAMSKNTRVMQELVATAERKLKLRKIVEQANAHGDTALMMACVAKNVTAVQLLLELGASMSAVNASGLNALMCAARVGADPRPGAPSVDEMMERSAAIVEVLLAHGADVNAIEKAGGNTALHLAVLSENLAAVQALISNAPDLDITVRNEAENTALDVSKRISGVASAQMEDLLSLKWSQYEKVAAQASAQVERELIDLVLKEDEGAADRKKPVAAKSGKRKTKKMKNKVDASKSVSKGSQSGSSETNEPSESNREHVNVGARSANEAAEQTPGVISEIHEEDEGNWQSVLPKKSRRKELPDEKTLRGINRTQHKPSANKTVKKNPRTPTRRDAAPRQTTQKVLAPSTEHKAPWAIQTTSGPKPSESVSPRSQVTSDEDEVVSSSISYELLNESFRRTFPVAAELEIEVEKFLIASSVSDRELEPNDSLSISQVEALQEAHWQAYHYLNEKKIELTRVLEAQRVEAQFALHHELMQMK
ncbi:hypothetical protein PR003_g8780 [Phytophthora rubi]|uniref:Uncharacterized protein n=1 Tax=Phytophthora rubi TaxID=129364 RepID=A0A6A4FI15_9STRA|nr:hypothetical protein PR002_g8325 [Phytophthora rubi]KAE9343809.1 hypothetical protein PR003_g8780 [Phytophthora rubi]